MRAVIPFGYAGSKVGLLGHILPNIPPHEAYVEPFFGSGAVFFNKEPSVNEIINDLDDNIVTFYRVLQDKKLFRELFRRIYYTPYSDTIYRDCKKVLAEKDKHDALEVAYATYVCINMSINRHTMARGNNIATTYRTTNNAVSYKNRKKHLLYLHERIQRAHITNRDAIELIKQAARSGVFFFCDPPYYQATNYYKSDNSLDFHKRFLETVKSIDCPVMITHYKNDLYEAELKDWYKIEIPKPNYMRIIHKDNWISERPMQVEVIYANYRLPSLK